MKKKYNVEAIVENPPVYDEPYEITIEISDEEIENLIEGEVKLYWARNAIYGWEYLEAFAPEAFRQAVELAEEFFVPMFGEQMKLENGASYSFLLPYEVYDIIFSDKRYRRERNLRSKQRKKSERRFHIDGKLLYEEYRKGRFLDKLCEDPMWNNQIFPGMWSNYSEDTAGSYSFHTTALVQGEKVKVDYFRKYGRDKVELEISLNSINETMIPLLEEFMSRFKKDGYKDVSITSINVPWELRTIGLKPQTDIEHFMKLVEALIQL